MSDLHKLTIRKRDPERSMIRGNVELLLDGKEISATAINIRMRPGELPSATVAILCDVEFHGEVLCEIRSDKAKPREMEMKHMVCMMRWFPGRWPWSKGRRICIECGRES